MKLLNNLLLLPSDDNSELLSSGPFFSLTENRNTLISHYILTKVTNTIFFFVRYFSLFFILHINIYITGIY